MRRLLALGLLAAGPAAAQDWGGGDDWLGGGDEFAGVAEPDAADLKADIKVEDKENFHVHTVKGGDTLSKIAKAYYGKAGQYMDIFNANKDQLSNPDVIKPGQVLKIPAP